MIGTRRDNPDGWLPAWGEYGRDANGDWFGMTPNGHLANLSGHDVTEHEDGTITVAPSILVSYPATTHTPRRDLYHGFLERGEWRSV